ncbi:U3 small nucleolar RNA-interacting protein 2-like isoform 2-T2 [Hipposideros larvatus]
MSATTVARKRGKPATGARVGAAAGKRRRKADSAGDRGKTKGGGKMNEEISSDSENERYNLYTVTFTFFSVQLCEF